MKKFLKSIVTFIFAFAVMCSTINVNAASKEDYKALKYAKVEDVGANQISITGKGIFAVKVGGTVNDANAAIFKDTVNPRNFKATFKFDKDYGNGEGVNAGWYSVNFSRTPNWFSSVKSVIKKNDIYGVNITMKLDPMDKKVVHIQPSRYSPGSGFVYLLDSTKIDIKKDWECTLEIKDSKLYLDGTFITDLGDAFSLALPDDKAFVGFGGFSESFYDVGMTVTYDGEATRNDYDNYGKETTSSDSNTNTDKNTNTNTNKNENNNSNNDADKNTEVDSDDKTVSEDTENSSVNDKSDTTTDTEGTSSKEDANEQQDAAEADEEYIYVDITKYVVAGVAASVAIVVVIGLIIFLILKKKA